MPPSLQNPSETLYSYFKDSMSQPPAPNSPPSSSEPLEAPTWTRHLPESFGIRQSVQQSKYRWCVRESAMWGIATGTAMGLHRIRMQSPLTRVANASFLSFFAVYLGSYYFCVKRRDHKEKMVSTGDSDTSLLISVSLHSAHLPHICSISHSLIILLISLCRLN